MAIRVHEYIISRKLEDSRCHVLFQECKTSLDRNGIIPVSEETTIQRHEVGNVANGSVVGKI
jgi:hypothetical protein